MKKSISLVLALVLMFSLLIGGQAFAAEKNDETLRVCLAEEPAQLIKTVAEIGASGLYVSSAMVDSILWYDAESGEIKPNIGTEWEWLDDLHLQLKIRDDVIAQDGTPLTANDIYYTCKIATEAGITDTNMLDFEECSVVDDYTVIIGLKQPYATFVDKLCNDGFLTPVSESAVEAVGGLEAATRCPKVFTGPYIFDEWVDGQYIRLVRNDNYWNTERHGVYKYIEYTFVPDGATRAMALQSGDVDVATSLSAAQDSMIEGSPDVVPANGTALSSKLIYFNCAKAPFDDIRVREAIWDLIDVYACIAIAENGKSVPTEANLSPASTVYRPRPEGFVREVDVDAAKALLADAGYPDGFECELQIEALDSTVAELIQDQLSAAGIKVNISPVESVTIQENIANGNYDMCLTFSFHSDPARILNRFDSRLFYTSAGGGGFFYASDELDAMVDRAKSAFDDEERLDAYGDIQDFVIENFLCVGLYGNIQRHAARSNITNFTFNLPGNLLIAYLQPAE